MIHFTPVSALLGGALIGLAASLLLLTHGKVAGISGLYGGIFRRSTSDRWFRVAFIGGLLVTGATLRLFLPGAFPNVPGASVPLILVAGLLVGFGTQLGNGCTSGHGVCGISRLSLRSFIATLTFIAAGIATVFVARHLLGGA